MSNIIIDSREKDLIEISKFNEDNVEIKQLNLGDIMIDNIIIERKTWSDLASSILDGRYKEQGERLEQAKENGFIIYYFIEGNLDMYIERGIKKDTLISTIFSLTHNKEFFVIQTKSTQQTYNFLMKLKKKKETIEKKTCTNTILCKKKNSKITKENISELMICQIPSISLNTCNILLNRFKNIQTIILELETNEHLFEEFTYEKKETIKKLNKNVIENLNYFLRK